MRRRLQLLAVPLLAAGVAAGALLLRTVPQQPGPGPAPPRSPVFAPAPLLWQVATADEAAIRANGIGRLTAFRLDSNPQVVVLDFASLAEQGAMLNRVAAFVEKAGMPRDRVLRDAELDRAIRANGDTAESFYYGHDYPAVALARFFAAAAAAAIPLDPQEARLRALLDQLGWFAPGAVGALISVPQAGPGGLDPAMRAAILHHELSHGEFFTDPRYADFVRQFWQAALHASERDGFRQFLGRLGYDTSVTDLLPNEMQAYLVFTDDPRFFLPRNVGMSEERREQLRAAFVHDMPSGWLRDMADQRWRP